MILIVMLTEKTFNSEIQSDFLKGRYYYDYLFYIGKGSSFNLQYLENKLKKTSVLKDNEKLTLDKAKELLAERFKNVNYESAKEDVSNFINDKDSLRL